MLIGEGKSLEPVTTSVVMSQFNLEGTNLSVEEKRKLAMLLDRSSRSLSLKGDFKSEAFHQNTQPFDTTAYSWAFL